MTNRQKSTRKKTCGNYQKL